MNKMIITKPDSPDEAVMLPIEPFVSREYALAEGEKLWPKVWQMACRVEEVPDVGDYVTYDIMDESIIVVRSSTEVISAYFNVCQHRGRRLTKGCGHTNQFFCPFHGWSWNIDGSNRRVFDREDFGDTLEGVDLGLPPVQVGTWGGWVWINMDPDAEPLEQYLEPAFSMLAAFELDKMRFRWRQWLVFPCNWKTALGAFNESYHVSTSHPQLTRGAPDMAWWCRAEGRHAWHGPAGLRGTDAKDPEGLSAPRGEAGHDPRVAVANSLDMMWKTLEATTTETFVKASKRLVDELPEGATMEEVGHHLLASAKADDAARGVIWPEIEPEHLAACGIDWHIFPNMIVLPSLTTALCYRARPNGDDPDSCIFEVFVLERFPEGEEPETEWVFEPDPTEEKWRLILAQDFNNMPEVQKGMKSRGFRGPRLNPVSELPVTHFFRQLAEYMGDHAPIPVKGG
jgi:nitrite reductase/ring-hydroxylating ferredoxin subunit